MKGEIVPYFMKNIDSLELEEEEESVAVINGDVTE